MVGSPVRSPRVSLHLCLCVSVPLALYCPQLSVCNMCLKMEDHRGHGLIGPVDAVSMLHSMTDKLLKDAQAQAEKLTFAMSHCDGVRVVPLFPLPT